MTRLRFAEMNIISRSLLFATLMAITATFVGCNKSQPTANGPQTESGFFIVGAIQESE